MRGYQSNSKVGPSRTETPATLLISLSDQCFRNAWHSSSGKKEYRLSIFLSSLESLSGSQWLHGEQQLKPSTSSLPSRRTCTNLSWNSEGELLALITDSAFTLFIWDAATKKVSRLDTGFQHQLSLICWGKTGQLMAITSSKGNVLIYDPSVHRKLPIISKHSRRITTGCWSRQNLLALLSEDGTITVSNRDGETMLQTGVKGETMQMQFNFLRLDSEGPGNSSSTTDNCLSLIVNRKVLFLINIHDSEVPVTFSFPTEHGFVVSYCWFREGLILVGFSGGTFSVISSHANDFGKEVSSFRAHRDSLTCFTYCLSSKKLASCSGNTWVDFLKPCFAITWSGTWGLA